MSSNIERFSLFGHKIGNSSPTNNCYDEKYTVGSDEFDMNERSYCNLRKFLKSDPKKTCLPVHCNLDTIHPGHGFGGSDDYYDLDAVRFDSTVNGQVGCPVSRDTVPSIFIGPGTRTSKLIADGWLPVSLTDRCAMLHDYGYIFSCGTSDSQHADRALARNLNIVRTVFKESSHNTQTAERLTSAGHTLGTTVGPSKLSNEGWGNPLYMRQAADIINTLEETLGLDIGYFERYRCGPFNPITRKRKVVLIKPICGSVACLGNPGDENGYVESVPPLCQGDQVENFMF